MDLTRAIVTAVEAIKPCVVHIRAIEKDGETVTLGSGVVFDHQRVLTNAQVVSGGEREVAVHTWQGRRYEAEVVGVDPLYFMTVLEIDGWLPAEPPEIMTAGEVELGLPVIAAGNAVGHDHNVTFGIVSGVDRTIYRPERFPVDGLVITDARIHAGNTGGALAALDGRLVALNGIPWQHGLSLGVHADVVWRLTHQIIDFGRATHPWLGFSGEPEVVDQAVVDLFSLSFQRGVTVAYVAPNGPGQRAGIQSGDMVVRVKDDPVTNLGSIRRALAFHRHGEEVPVTVLREGDMVELAMRVDEMPRLDSRGES